MADRVRMRAMKIALIGCPFRNFYSGMYIDALRQSLGRRNDVSIDWISAHCGCEDPIGRGRVFQSQDTTYFEMRQIKLYRSSNPIKRGIRLGLRNLLYRRHAARYAALSGAAEVVHFHQIANAFGADVVFHWLRARSQAARVVTVHELDEEQLEFKVRNRTYNRADAIIVHCEDMRRQLVELGVKDRLIRVVLHGTAVTPLSEDAAREGLVYYGGHFIMRGKNVQAMFEAYALLLKRHGSQTPRLRIHGQWGSETPPEALQLAQRNGIEKHIDWLNTLEFEEVNQLYRQSLLAVMPYSTSFAGWPIGFVAANALPVIATRRGGIPDHIGEAASWIQGDDPKEIADRIDELLADAPRRVTMGRELRLCAERYLDWDRVAEATLAVYQIARDQARRR